MDWTNKYDRALSASGYLAAPLPWLDRSKYESLIREGSEYLSMALASPGVEAMISSSLSRQFNVNSTVYDGAIDAIYNETRVGGSVLHHNVDGSHTWTGALEALREAFPNDPEHVRAYHATLHLARDLTTPSGINPLVNPESFVSAKHFLTESIGLSAHAANDLLNLNAAEVCGAGVAAVALALGMRRPELSSLGRLGGRLLLAGYIAGNPALLLVSTVCLGRACYGLWRGDSLADLVGGLAVGGVTAAGFFATAAIVSGPVFVGVIAGAAAAAAVNHAAKAVASALRDDIEQVLGRQFTLYRGYSASL